MASANGTAAVAEQETQVVEVSAPKTVDVTIHPPDVITFGMWQEYNTARLAFAEKNPNVDAFTAKYYGALAVIKAGYFHIDGVEKLRLLTNKSEAEQRSVPLAVIGFVVRYIAMPIEAALDQPLNDDFLNQL